MMLEIGINFRALDGIDYVVHAYTKIVPTASTILLNVKNNIDGAMNVIMHASMLS